MAALALLGGGGAGPGRGGLRRAAGGCWAAAAILAVLASGAVGGFHVGVEQGWWPSPLPGCQAPRATLGGSVDDMMRSLSAAPSKPCDAPTYLVPGLPVSMAAMNLLYALGLSGLGLILLRERSQSMTRRPPRAACQATRPPASMSSG